MLGGLTVLVSLGALPQVPPWVFTLVLGPLALETLRRILSRKQRAASAAASAAQTAASAATTRLSTAQLLAQLETMVTAQAQTLLALQAQLTAERLHVAELQRRIGVVHELMALWPAEARQRLLAALGTEDPDDHPAGC